ncbi:MAG: hypothetical protein RID91_14830 [Azospirillaceae bacterium]
MSLSPQCRAMLIDLVEIKLSCMDVWDREDKREQAILQRCLDELRADAAGEAGLGGMMPRRRRGRPPKRDYAALNG